MLCMKLETQEIKLSVDDLIQSGKRSAKSIIETVSTTAQNSSLMKQGSDSSLKIGKKKNNRSKLQSIDTKHDWNEKKYFIEKGQSVEVPSKQHGRFPEPCLHSLLLRIV